MYAQSIPALSPYLEKVDTSDPKAVLDLLIMYTNYDFGSAAVRQLPRVHSPKCLSTEWEC